MVFLIPFLKIQVSVERQKSSQKEARALEHPLAYVPSEDIFQHIRSVLTNPERLRTHAKGRTGFYCRLGRAVGCSDQCNQLAECAYGLR